jgi:hypothetical protein
MLADQFQQLDLARADKGAVAEFDAQEEFRRMTGLKPELFTAPRRTAWMSCKIVRHYSKRRCRTTSDETASLNVHPRILSTASSTGHTKPIYFLYDRGVRSGGTPPAKTPLRRITEVSVKQSTLECECKTRYYIHNAGDGWGARIRT